MALVMLVPVQWGTGFGRGGYCPPGIPAGTDLLGADAMAGSVNRGRDLVCCHYCGRDTRAADGICSRCRGVCDYSGLIGRRQLPVTQAKTPFDAAEERSYEPRAAERYHGESIRDDL
jgi:hypothetical protein